jgi:hypothetical protein
MSNESTIKTISLTIITAIVFIISYLFFREGSDLYILIMFFGFFLSIILASGYLKTINKK